MACRRRTPLSLAIARLLLLLALPFALGAVRAAETDKEFDFPQPGLCFFADFPGARLSACSQISDEEYQAVIRPETPHINNSSWYAFQVRSLQPRKIRVRLTYEDGSHRYPPKVSQDGKSWTRLPRSAYRYDQQEKQMVLELEVRPEPLWVAAQEMVTEKEFRQWIDHLAGSPFVAKSEIGRSVAGRPLVELTIGRRDTRWFVMIIGRQHPPEVTGSMALMAFVEVIAGDSALACELREHVQTVVVPLVNPDGVESGDWRCNSNRVDVNRDWVKFDQPETRAVRDEFQRLVADGKKPRLWLDFHSTSGDAFLTQADEQKTDPPDFAKRWLGALSVGLPDYQVHRVSSYGPTLACSTNWAYRRFGIPAITYEVGDNTDRALIRRVAQTAAVAMMRFMKTVRTVTDAGTRKTTKAVQPATK